MFFQSVLVMKKISARRMTSEKQKWVCTPIVNDIQSTVVYLFIKGDQIFKNKTQNENLLKDFQERPFKIIDIIKNNKIISKNRKKKYKK